MKKHKPFVVKESSIEQFINDNFETKKSDNDHYGSTLNPRLSLFNEGSSIHIIGEEKQPSVCFINKNNKAGLEVGNVVVIEKRSCYDHNIVIEHKFYNIVEEYDDVSYKLVFSEHKYKDVTKK